MKNVNTFCITLYCMSYWHGCFTTCIAYLSDYSSVPWDPPMTFDHGIMMLMVISCLWTLSMFLVSSSCCHISSPVRYCDGTLSHASRRSTKQPSNCLTLFCLIALAYIIRLLVILVVYCDRHHYSVVLAPARKRSTKYYYIRLFIPCTTCSELTEQVSIRSSNHWCFILWTFST